MKQSGRDALCTDSHTVCQSSTSLAQYQCGAFVRFSRSSRTEPARPAHTTNEKMMVLCKASFHIASPTAVHSTTTGLCKQKSRRKDIGTWYHYNRCVLLFRACRDTQCRHAQSVQQPDLVHLSLRPKEVSSLRGGSSGPVGPWSLAWGLLGEAEQEKRIT